MTLSTWQLYNKPISELLYNCSEFDRLNDEWVDFPIGMGWKYLDFKNRIHVQNGEHKQLVMCAINPHTDRRRRPINGRDVIMRRLADNGIFNQIYDSKDYFGLLGDYKFVISPEGNGIDCHRHYEALMAGAIPIVETHAGIAEKYTGCPILFTKDYSEITPAYLETTYESMKHKVYDFSKLILSSYDSETQKSIKENGNYWCSRHFGKKWYAI